MQSNDRKASWLFRVDPHNHHNFSYQTVQSPHEGDFKDTFAKRGYSDYDDDAKKKRTIDMDCDFERAHSLKRAFDALGMRTGSTGKGAPNQCFQIDHKDGPKILRDKENRLPSIENQQYIDESCGKVYKPTGAVFEFAINPEAGALTLLNVVTPAFAAKQYWNRIPRTEELPHIRSISDVA